MPKQVYYNNECLIEIDRQDQYESKVNVNGENLIWISNDQAELFSIELSAVLDKYRI